MDNAPQAITLLGCHIFRNLFTQCPNDNVLVSPHAAMIVVSLLMAGSQRTTEREMAEALKVKLPQFHTSMRRILVFAPFGNSPAPEDEDTAFRMANRILVNSSLPLSDSFRKIGQRVYRTLVSSANLARRSAEERRLVNTWAEAITGIKQVIPPDCPLDGDSRIVLVSSATLDTLWKLPFPKIPTMRRPFGSWTAVPTMGQTAMVGYACIQELGLRAVELPFSSDSYSATIIMPTGKFDELCVNLTPEVLNRVFEAVKERQKVRIELPRFSATFEAELTDVLQKLGIREAFTDEANFRTVTTATPVSLTWVLHKVQVGVHEGVTPTLPQLQESEEPSSAPAPDVVEFLVNQPFVLCVRKGDILVLLASIQRVHVP
ncbi:serpin A3-7 [Dermacentor silvarum]|uniref:serpin A3-7 n=1 Tax=Dermacentor silvarum TaxID=543639 RepID=UPI0021009752|nr:serpin A3-7 [Dermacentor silvarum]